MVLLELSVLMEGTNNDKAKKLLRLNYCNAIIRRLTLEYYSGEYLDGTYCRDKYTRS